MVATSIVCFDTIRHVHSSRKSGSGFRMLGAVCDIVVSNAEAHETVYELQFSNSSNTKLPQLIPPSLAS